MFKNEASEYKSLFKSILILLLETIPVLAGLYVLSWSTGAGSESFHTGIIFVLLQALIIIISYGLWYQGVNRCAADLINNEQMRNEAHRRMPGALFRSIIITGSIAVLAVPGTLLRIIFADINQVYCLSATLSELVIGNITLLFTMLFWGLPDRIQGM